MRIIIQTQFYERVIYRQFFQLEEIQKKVYVHYRYLEIF